MSDVLILCYHAVSRTWAADLSVTPKTLEAQLVMLLRRGWRGASFSEAVRRPPPWRRTLVITFDDAFLSVLELAYPILSRLDIPGTIFAPTAFLAERGPLQWAGVDHWLDSSAAPELTCMSWNDLRVLADDGWEVGSHTCTHARLTELDDDALRHELVESKRECEEQLERPCETLAYPYGAVDERVVAFTAEAGYTAALALSSSLRPGGPHRWPRVGIYHADQMWRFRLKLNPTVRRIRASRMWPAHE
jgi:peptidoglycan/xylan/chitin deacetylase (PgdA/CDA1 family)